MTQIPNAKNVSKIKEGIELLELKSTLPDEPIELQEISRTEFSETEAQGRLSVCESEEV